MQKKSHECTCSGIVLSGVSRPCPGCVANTDVLAALESLHELIVGIDRADAEQGLTREQARALIPVAGRAETILRYSRVGPIADCRCSYCRWVSKVGFPARGASLPDRPLDMAPGVLR